MLAVMKAVAVMGLGTVVRIDVKYHEDRCETGLERRRYSIMT